MLGILCPSGRRAESRASFVKAEENWPNTVNILPITLKST